MIFSSKFDTEEDAQSKRNEFACWLIDNHVPKPKPKKRFNPRSPPRTGSSQSQLHRPPSKRRNDGSRDLRATNGGHSTVPRAVARTAFNEPQSKERSRRASRNARKTQRAEKVKEYEKRLEGLPKDLYEWVSCGAARLSAGTKSLCAANRCPSSSARRSNKPRRANGYDGEALHNAPQRARLVLCVHCVKRCRGMSESANI